MNILNTIKKKMTKLMKKLMMKVMKKMVQKIKTIKMMWKKLMKAIR